MPETARPTWRSRIVRSGWIDPEHLLAHPLNYRIHPAFQSDALRANLDELGQYKPLVIQDGTDVVIDGHARVALALRDGIGRIWCDWVDLDDAEARVALATGDPISALAAFDRGKYRELLDGTASGEAATMALLSQIAAQQGIIPPDPDSPGAGRADAPAAQAWSVTEDYSDPAGDGIVAETGYRLASIWYGMTRTNEVRPYMLDLPARPDAHDGATVKLGYSRTNAEETERIVKTYLRPGDRFYELCCGWMTFSSTAKFYGFSGRGSDIWDVSLDFCRRQLAAMPGAGIVDVVRADCRATGEPDAAYDFVHSNPPFFNLEPYGGGPDDLAQSSSYARWLDAMADMGAEAARILRPGGLANFVINDYREDGVLVPMHADFIAAIQRRSDLVLHDLVVAEVVSQALRFRRHDYDRRRTVKCHEYVLTFRRTA